MLFTCKELCAEYTGVWSYEHRIIGPGHTQAHAHVCMYTHARKCAQNTHRLMHTRACTHMHVSVRITHTGSCTHVHQNRRRTHTGSCTQVCVKHTQAHAHACMYTHARKCAQDTHRIMHTRAYTHMHVSLHTSLSQVPLISFADPALSFLHAPAHWL